MNNNIISDDTWCRYMRDGYLKLGSVMTGNELSSLQQRINEIMLGTAALDYGRILMQLDSETGAYGDAPESSRGHKGASLNYRKIQDLEFDDLFLAFMQKPLFQEICAQGYGAHAGISAFRAMFMNKPAHKGTILPWHQDGGAGWSLDRDPLVTIWTALDPATIANGCVQVIPGSHRLGLLSEFGHTITKEQVAEFCPEEKIQYLEAEPGEAFLLHNWLLHRSDVNKTEIPRRAFSVCYMDARTVSNAGEQFSTIFGNGALGVANLRKNPIAA